MGNQQEPSKLDTIIANQHLEWQEIQMQGKLFAEAIRDTDARLIDKTTRGILEDDVKRGHMAAACRVTIKVTFWLLVLAVGLPGWIIAVLLYLNMIGVL